MSQNNPLDIVGIESLVLDALAYLLSLYDEMALKPGSIYAHALELENAQLGDPACAFFVKRALSMGIPVDDAVKTEIADRIKAAAKKVGFVEMATKAGFDYSDDLITRAWQKADILANFAFNDWVKVPGALQYAFASKDSPFRAVLLD